MSISPTIKIFPPVAVAVTSVVFCKISPEIFAISALAGVMLATFVEECFKSYFFDDKPSRQSMTKLLGGIICVCTYLDMRTTLAGNLIFIQNKQCSYNGFFAGIVVAQYFI